LVLDEPTAFLPAPSVEKIFKAIRKVAGRGSAVVFVSHRLDEILDIADRTSILRDGGLIETLVTKQRSERKLDSAMLGRELASHYPKRRITNGRSVLRVDNLSGRVART